MTVLERIVRDRRRRGQFAFAEEAKDHVTPHEALLLGKSHRGLHLVALREASLARALVCLRQTYGAALSVESPADGEPVMAVRIGLEVCWLDGVRRALAARGARPTEEYVGTHYCVLRFDLPASRLFGLPAELAALSLGRATHQIVVVGHAQQPCRKLERSANDFRTASLHPGPTARAAPPLRICTEKETR